MVCDELWEPDPLEEPEEPEELGDDTGADGDEVVGPLDDTAGELDAIVLRVAPVEEDEDTLVTGTRCAAGASAAWWRRCLLT